MGLSDARVQTVLAAANSAGSDGRRQVLIVVRHSTCSTTDIKEKQNGESMGTMRSSPSSPSSCLQEGDVLIEVCGRLVTRFDDVEAAVDELVAKQQRKKHGDLLAGIDVIILRNKKEITVKVPLRVAACQDTTRVVVFGGLVCQHHHRAHPSCSNLVVIKPLFLCQYFEMGLSLCLH